MNNVNPLLNAVKEDVMGFLNEIQLQYPNAISLASGRPDENHFDIQGILAYFDIYVDAISAGRNMDRVLKGLGQYNRTKGIINDLVSHYLEKDESVIANPGNILITVGTQEALAIAVMTLCDKEQDVILVEDPSYIGLTHFSIIGGYSIDAVPMRCDGVCLEGIEEKIIKYSKAGKKVKLVYVIPDFQNPTGSYMYREKRKQFFEMASKYDFYILEDNAYGDFIYEGEGLPPIKAFDNDKSGKEKRVIYVRSFSKSIFPSLRLAAMVADQEIEHSGGSVSLSDLMAKTKGYLTVNTSSINQAILGGILIKNDFSLKGINREKVADLKRKRDLLLLFMDKYLDKTENDWSKDISWNVPKGGFFMTISVPFEVNRKEVILCAEEFNFIMTPMSFFYLASGGEHEIRIAFSNLAIENIESAVKRLAAYFKSKL